MIVKVFFGRGFLDVFCCSCGSFFFSLGEDFLHCIGNPSVVFFSFLFFLNLSSDPYGF